MTQRPITSPTKSLSELSSDCGRDHGIGSLFTDEHSFVTAMKEAGYMVAYGAGEKKISEHLSKKIVFDIESRSPVADHARAAADITAFSQFTVSGNIVTKIDDSKLLERMKIDMAAFHKALTGHLLPDYQRTFLTNLMGKQQYADKNDDVMHYGFTIKVVEANTGEILIVDRKNVNDYEKHGYVRVPDGACEACAGIGSKAGEDCWHCGGSGEDPVIGG